MAARPPPPPPSGAANSNKRPQLPHERDETAGRHSTARPGRGAAGENQHRVGRQAADDLAKGQVDTDMRDTPGLDAERREELTRPGKDHS